MKYRTRRLNSLGLPLCLLLILTAPVSAQEQGGGPDLAAAAQNPIASTVRFPLESNFLFYSNAYFRCALAPA